MKHPAFKYFIALGLTAGLLYLAFRGQDLGKALEMIEHARILPLVAGLLLMLFSHAVRAYRWQIVLRSVKEKTSFITAFKATLAGYGMNNLVPRSGEVARPYLMSKKEGIPMASAMASVVVERLTDVLALAALLGFSLITYKDKLVAAFPMLTGDVIAILAAMTGVLVLFIAIFFSESRSVTMMKILTRPLPPALGSKLQRIAAEFSVGLRGLDKRATLPLLLGSVAIWVLYGLSMYLSLQGFDDPAMAAIPLSGAFVLLTLSGISFTIPTPGGSGTYHFFISQGLLLIFGVPQGLALAYAVITHASSFIVVTLIGVIIMLREGLSFGQKVPAPEVNPALALD